MNRMIAANHPVLVEANAKFESFFGYSPQVAVFAPGRVNLIGEHTDYNDGFVLPFALPFKTVIVGSLSNSKECNVISCDMDHECSVVSFEVNADLCKGTPKWANYIKGTIYQYLEDLPDHFSFNAVIASNVPVGAGLSSSAALEVAMATFLEQLCNITHVSKVTKALRCQKAEHTFADTPCGIMDQFVSALAEKDQLVMIDCRSHEHTFVPYGAAQINKPVLLVTNSHVKHSLGDSAYVTRVAECKKGLEILRRAYPEVSSYRDISIEQVKRIEKSFPPVIYQRVLHVVTENDRTVRTVEALKNGDFVTVGRLMVESHASLQQNYEVSCEELDLLVELAMQVPGVLGTRMTGGGFGGCTITLVERNSVRTLETFLQTEYEKRTGKLCSCFECLPAEGAREITLKPSKSAYPIAFMCVIVAVVAVFAASIYRH